MMDPVKEDTPYWIYIKPLLELFFGYLEIKRAVIVDLPMVR